MAATKMEKMCWVWNVIAVLFVKIVLPNFQKIYSIFITLNNLTWFFAPIPWNVKVTYFHEQYWLVLGAVRVRLCLQFKFLVFRWLQNNF